MCVCHFINGSMFYVSCMYSSCFLFWLLFLEHLSLRFHVSVWKMKILFRICRRAPPKFNSGLYGSLFSLFCFVPPQFFLGRENLRAAKEGWHSILFFPHQKKSNDETSGWIVFFCIIFVRGQQKERNKIRPLAAADFVWRAAALGLKPLSAVRVTNN